MYKMFDSEKAVEKRTQGKPGKTVAAIPSAEDFYKEFKVGKLAQVVLGRMLEEGKASKEEIRFMQTADYSKQFFGLNYPLLVRANTSYDPVRYYAKPLIIDGTSYKMCSQWFETAANNDRPFLIKWIQTHK